MQTFLPYEDFRASARVLDRQRLGKQRVEAKQILQALERPGEPSGWEGIPQLECGELEDGLYPPWLGCPDFHRAHRSALLRKYPAHYANYWLEDPDLPYIWPV